jgi:hypothetical protein
MVSDGGGASGGFGCHAPLPWESMRLTVGPLQAAVYWRRRAVVLMGLAMVVLVVSYACGGPDVSNAVGDRASPTAGASTTTAAATPTATARPTPTPTPTAFTLPNTGATGPCGDGELDVTATAASGQVPRGQAVDVTIKIKNVSGRTCSRDVGADMQELSLLDGTIVVWSSDDCNPRKGSDLRSFGPAKEISFTLTWAGQRSRTGTGTINCAAPAPEAAVYQLVARLDRKLSAPFSLRIAG